MNRVSVGGQSFHDKHLETLGRIHQAVHIGRAVDALRAGGIERVSVDLILAIPGQSLAEQAPDLARDGSRAGTRERLRIDDRGRHAVR